MLFGVSFAYVEAAVVVYLRHIYEPLVLELNADAKPGDLFPLVTLEQLEATDAAYLALLKTEVIREAATMVLLASMGLAVGWNFNSGFAAFVIAFGIWDIGYYLFLKALISWPSSLLDWDLLFLIPVPWVGPVLAPVLIAIAMIAGGTLVLWRETNGNHVRIGWHHWLAMVLGAVVIVLAFCWDFREMMAGGVPSSFPWSVFIVGMVIGSTAFVSALVGSIPSSQSAPPEPP